MVTIQTAVTALGSGAIGAASVGWATRLMIKRLIDQYDYKHQAHEKRFEKLVERFSEGVSQLQLKIVRLEEAVNEVKRMREDFRDIENRTAVLEREMVAFRTKIEHMSVCIVELRSMLSV